jgi:5-methyltetrahydrofolate--homocysteine methyltransferase
MSNIYELLDQGQTLISDGAMGTMLQDAGLTDGGAPELWNVEHPDKVAEILEQYAKSGANLLTTNTFGGTKPRLQMHQLEERVFELNKAAAELAKKVASKYPNCFVMGDIGPSGELMEPMGILTIDSAKEIFAEQIKGLVAGGVDGILIETMSDLSEVEAAVKALNLPNLTIYRPGLLLNRRNDERIGEKIAQWFSFMLTSIESRDLGAAMVEHTVARL